MIISIICIFILSILTYICFKNKKNISIEKIKINFAQSSTALQAYNLTLHYFSKNRDKYIMRKIALEGFWNNDLVIEYQVKNKKNIINFNELLGDLIKKKVEK